MNPRTLTTLALLALSACTPFRVRTQNEALGGLAEFEGKVSDGDLPVEAGKPIIVLLQREDLPEPHVQATTVLYRPGPYHFFANEGRYSVHAFADLNSNLQVDPGEPRAAYAKELLLRDGKLTASIDLTLGNDSGKKAPQWKPNHDELIGIYDDRLRERMGRKGGWAPGEWRADNGDDRLYLMEPFDPNRLPVVFVHGTGGTPEDMHHLVENLDKSRYQVWFFWYASGMRMNLSAQNLKASLDEFRVLHDFKDVVVVSQCVGGLVARNAVVQLQDRDHHFDVSALVTFSTPWLGHGMAASGTSISPMTVPAWYDMAEGSKFQKDAIATAIPQVPHYMFFSYGKGRDMGDDGTVPLDSMLQLDMQRRATEVIGFSETHMGIVQEKAPIDHFNEVLSKVQTQVAKKHPSPASPPTSLGASAR